MEPVLCLSCKIPSDSYNALCTFCFNVQIKAASFILLAYPLFFFFLIFSIRCTKHLLRACFIIHQYIVSCPWSVSNNLNKICKIPPSCSFTLSPLRIWRWLMSGRLLSGLCNLSFNWKFTGSYLQRNDCMASNCTVKPKHPNRAQYPRYSHTS